MTAPHPTTLDPGFAFLDALRRIIDGRPFPAEATVHATYCFAPADRRWEAVEARADEGYEASIALGLFDIAAVWQDVGIWAANDGMVACPDCLGGGKIVELTRRELTALTRMPDERVADLIEDRWTVVCATCGGDGEILA